MSDQPKPNLSLGAAPGRLKSKQSAGSRGWLVAILLLQALVAVLVLRNPKASNPQAESGTRNADEWKQLAIELEDRSLDGQAAAAWEKYLDANRDSESQAEILYRIGTLYMQAEQFDRAASALVRCELVAKDDTNIESKVGQLMVTCLRRLGMYGEVGRELSRRVEEGAGTIKQGKVLATLAGEALTDADLDRMIQRRVDQMLAMQGAASDPLTREALVRQFSQAQMRQQMLNELLQLELFTRRARELKLDQEDEFLDARQAIEAQLLASQFQQQQVDKIQATDIDIQAFYKANADRYQRPEQMQVLLFALDEDDDAANILDNVKSAEEFKQVALERRKKSDNPADAGELAAETIVRGRSHPRLGDVDGLFDLDVGQWTTEPHEHAESRYLVLVETKTPVRTPPLDEIKRQVEFDYTTRKRQELTEKLFADLIEKYDVRIMPLTQENASDEDAEQDE